MGLYADAEKYALGAASSFAITKTGSVETRRLKRGAPVSIKRQKEDK
jgi:hypothetical protein